MSARQQTLLRPARGLCRDKCWGWGALKGWQPPAWFSDDGVAELEIRSGGRSEEKEWKLPSPGESEARNPEWPVLNCLSPTCGMRIGPNSPSDEADSWLPLQDLNSSSAHQRSIVNGWKSQHTSCNAQQNGLHQPGRCVRWIVDGSLRDSEHRVKIEQLMIVTMDVLRIMLFGCPRRFL